MVYRYKYLAVLFILILCSSCGGFYDFKGISIASELKTFAVEDFSFSDVQCQSGVEQSFAEALRRQVRDESRLVTNETDPDITFIGQLTRCSTSYIAPTEDNTTSLNRYELTLAIEFINNQDEEQNWKKSYVAFQDFDSNADFQTLRDDLTDLIIEDIVERIFNDTFTNW